MLVDQVVPEGLAAIPPGPELARLLGSLDPGRVPNDDVVDVLIAQSRQLAHEQARMLVVLDEVICRRPFAGPGEIRRGSGPEPHAADEVRAALSWTRRAAERETDFAYAVVHRLPLVLQALDEGHIDRGKAWVFAHHLSDLTDAQIHTVCVAVLPHAERLTTGQLGERLRRMVLELDPGYYQRRYRKSVRERRVICYLDADGTATITATGLPADEAAAAIERVDTLARAARRAGHPGTLDQIRADIVLGLLDGSLHGFTREQIIDALIARYAGGDAGSDPDTTTAEIATTAGTPGGSAGRSGSSSCGRATGSDEGTGTGDDSTDGADQDGAGQDGAGGAASDKAVEPLGPVTTSARAAPGPGPVPAPVPVPVPAPGEDQRVGVEIRAPLPTLLGQDERAGELPGLGPVTADCARRTVARQRRAQWRWVVVDAEGHLVSEGITRRRPDGLTRTGPSGGVVELQISEADLTDLLADLADDPACCGAWAGVVADIAARHHRRDPARRIRDLDAHPHRRFPHAALRRHVQVRDRTCVHPGCRASACRADADHTIDHQYAGTTTQDDLAPLCRHDHMLKTEGGWVLHQPEPGRFVWHSPLGREYPVAPEPILPPVIRQVPRDPDPSFDEPAPDTDQPLALPARDRAPPPPHDPHTPSTCEQRDPHASTPHAHDRPGATGPEEDPPPF